MRGPRRLHLFLGLLAALTAVASLPRLAFADAPPGPFFQGFETDTSGWFDSSSEGGADAPSGTITREPSGYTNSGGYASGITSADGSFHARINFDQCANESTFVAQAGHTGVDCNAPFTRWGGYSSTFPAGGFSTSLDIYLDTSWASTHTDYRFDWSDAINDTSGNFLQEYVFNAGTAPVGGAGFFVTASTNATRSGAFPENPCPNPGPTSTPPNTCRTPVNITTSGWYTFTHTFRDDSGSLAVDMSITPVGSSTSTASWTILTGQAMSGVGGNRYGAFDNDEIADLAIDDSMRTGTESTAIPEAPWTAGLLLLGGGIAVVPLITRRRLHKG